MPSSQESQAEEHLIPKSHTEMSFQKLLPVLTGKKSLSSAGGILGIYNYLTTMPYIGSWSGNWLFSTLLGFVAPYSASISPSVLSLALGSCSASITQSRKLLNPFNSVHAAALINLGELTTGLAILTLLDTSGYIGIPVKLSAEYYKKARGVITASCELGNNVESLITTVSDDGVNENANGETRVDALKHELKKQIEVACDLLDQSGEKVATVTAVWSVRRRKADNRTTTANNKKSD